MARVLQLTPTFKDALDKAVRGDASQRRRVVRVALEMASGDLPMPGDPEALLPWPGGLGWVHEIRELGVWLQYRFDERHIEFLTVWTRPPVFVG